jgi:hypothetical protein
MAQDYWSKPSCQYNAVMLVRILADNPGEGFTRFIDKKFVDTTKELLRAGRDASVRQILMETLDAFETTKATDPGLAPLIAMWQKEKAKAFRAYGVSNHGKLVSRLVRQTDWDCYPRGLRRLSLQALTLIVSRHHRQGRHRRRVSILTTCLTTAVAITVLAVSPILSSSPTASRRPAPQPSFSSRWSAAPRLLSCSPTS